LFFHKGGVADAVFYIQHGNIKLIVVSEQGKEAVIAILGPGRRMSEWTSAAHRNFMNKFRDLGFIGYNGSIEVHSSLLSVLLHDKPQIKSQDGVDPEQALRVISSAASRGGGSPRPALSLAALAGGQQMTGQY
jgi:hypothetical protein